MFVSGPIGALASGQDSPIDFNREIRPLLSDRCYTCHGPDAANRKADLRLDVESSAKELVIIPGDVEASELYVRLTSDDPDLKMPPPGANLGLNDEEIARIGRWIDQGAKWSDHWSFVPPAVPTLPDEDGDGWAQNEIDYFVAARIKAAGLSPSLPASRERLIRRLAFDITGLPPTLDEIDAFVADRSPGAVERVVDRLLNTTAYGERMAATWLDVARYSDTYGYQVDRDRFVWPWRDWVIRAFNSNMPYDVFVTQQLAGDLLPDADDQKILATTFNRLHPQKVEGGSVPEEFRVEYVADRCQTFATAFLGLTMECCRCHDHKYDPISQHEYYGLFSFFDKIDEAGLYSYFTESVPTPTLLMLADSEKANIAYLEKSVVAAEDRLAALANQRNGEFLEWLQRRIEPADTTPHDETPNGNAGHAVPDRREPSADDGIAFPGRVAYLNFDGGRSDLGGNRMVTGRIGSAVELTGDDPVNLETGNFPRYAPFSVSLWMKTPDTKERAVVFHRSRAWTDAGSRGYELLLIEGRLRASLIHFWPGNAISVETVDELAVDRWCNVTVTYDGSSRAEGLRIYRDGVPAETVVVRNNLYKNITGGGGDNLAIGERFRDKGFRGGTVDEFQVFDRQLTSIEIRGLYDRESFVQTMRTPTAELTSSELDAIRPFYLSTKDRSYREALGRLQEARKRLCHANDEATEIMVMRERPGVRQTRFLRRGAYDAPDVEVKSVTPECLPRFPVDQERNRLGLARWLTSPQHPLASRVAVNRIWQMMFGEGLVRTPEDFGSQGEQPTHPRLLDWLATDFVRHGWDVKRLIKQIVTSATYQQTSDPSQDLLHRDPENRLLACASSYRLPAEMLRDNILAVSGLLVDTIGGPPARPYEVNVSFKPVERDEGEGLYRRSIYTYWKRTGPAPVMMTLDAAKRDVCRVKRERTASPLQAFVMLNDPQFVEAARVLADRALDMASSDNEAQEHVFRLLVGRRPTDKERGIIARLFDGQVAYFSEHPDAAAAFLSNGDAVSDSGVASPRLAALGVVASMLMNFDECVMKK